MGSGASPSELPCSFCPRPRKDESPADMPVQASALVVDAWQRRSCPNWRHESPGQSCAQRMAHGPFPAGALPAAAGIGCRSVPLPLVPPALAPIWKPSASTQPAARTLDALRSGHGAAHPRRHPPRCLAAAAYLALQGACADACLLAGHGPYGHGPFPEREAGPLHHRPCGDGELAGAPGALPLVRMAVHLGAGAVSAYGADEASGMLLLEEPPLAWLLVGISLQELQERASALAFLPAQSACMTLRHCFLRSSGCIIISSSLCGSGPTGIAGTMPEVPSHFVVLLPFTCDFAIYSPHFKMAKH